MLGRERGTALAAGPLRIVGGTERRARADRSTPPARQRSAFGSLGLIAQERRRLVVGRLVLFRDLKLGLRAVRHARVVLVGLELRLAAFVDHRADTAHRPVGIADAANLLRP